MALLFFEIFTFKIDTFLRSNQFSKHFFHSKAVTSEISVRNVSTAASDDSSRSPRILFLMFGNKKKSLGDKSGEYDNESSIRHYYWLKNQRFDVLCDSWRCHDEG